jgi:RNA-directed DNA polymerase
LGSGRGHHDELSFDSIPHDELLQSVARRIADGAVLRLIKLWLKAPIEERDGDGTRRMSGGKGNSRGTPQGGIATPPTMVQTAIVL